MSIKLKGLVEGAGKYRIQVMTGGNATWKRNPLHNTEVKAMAKRYGGKVIEDVENVGVLIEFDTMEARRAFKDIAGYSDWHTIYV